MTEAVETLFEPLQRNLIDWRGRRILFLNAMGHSALGQAAFTLQQFFKPLADVLKAQAEIPQGGDYDGLLMLFPKNMVEGRFMLAQGIIAVKPGGFIVVAADNKTGGARLRKICEGLGLSDVQDLSKNKARVVWALKKNINTVEIESALAEGAQKKVLDGAYLSQAGIFGWDKIDKGSEILVQSLPELHGVGADFGCGYGYLSREILQRHAGIQKLYCADADFRAVEAARQNLSSVAMCVWRDLTKVQADYKGLDFVVMNPPFHEGKKSDIGVGQSFIQNAYHALKAGGQLWMVANVHLPYEGVLNSLFKTVHKNVEKNGFKVFQAVK